MATLQINGSVKLKGEIEVYGAKNAALPCIAATLLTTDTCVLHNVPQIGDVKNLLSIMESMGAKIEWQTENTLAITCKEIDPQKLDAKLVKAIRSSVLLLGPMLVRFKEMVLPEPGGCIIGNRPLDAHIAVFKGLGCEINRTQDGIHVQTKQLIGNDVSARFSVTGTENALMAASGAQGVTTIHLSAREPHVVNVAQMLEKMGVEIGGLGLETMHVKGTSKLHGVEHTIIPDQIETGTFVAAVAATRGTVDIHNVVPEHFDAMNMILDDMKLSYKYRGDVLSIVPSGTLQAFKLQTQPYPGFPTDLQSPFGVLATQCAGTSLIHDTMFEGRMGYINELVKMGANAVVCDPHRVLISGPTPLYGTEVRSLDLRAGATMVIAGLLADGTTTIFDAQILDRGYYKLKERLSKLGAVMEYVS